MADGNIAYVHIVHPVVPGGDYTIMQTLYDAYPDERQALYEMYRARSPRTCRSPPARSRSICRLERRLRSDATEPVRDGRVVVARDRLDGPQGAGRAHSSSQVVARRRGATGTRADTVPGSEAWMPRSSGACPSESRFGTQKWRRWIACSRKSWNAATPTTRESGNSASRSRRCAHSSNVRRTLMLSRCIDA